MWQRSGTWVFLLQTTSHGVCNAYDFQVIASKPQTYSDAEAVARKICDLLNNASSQQAAIEALTTENARLREQIQQTAMPVLVGGFEMPNEDADEGTNTNVPSLDSGSSRASLLELD